MTVGSLGKLLFLVDSSRIRTICDLSWKSAANYSTHDLHLKKGKQEFVGVDPDEITFTLELSAFLGINPDDGLKYLSNILNRALRVPFVLGKQVIMEECVVSSLQRTANRFDKDGTPVSYTVKVTLQEYVASA